MASRLGSRRSWRMYGGMILSVYVDVGSRPFDNYYAPPFLWTVATELPIPF